MATKVVHRFLRQPNINSTVYNRIGNRFDPFGNTLSILEDPKSNRQVFLIGTTNSSTTLAYRTKKLIQEVKPTQIYVQASEQWWNYARHITVSHPSCRWATKKNSLKPLLPSRPRLTISRTTSEGYSGE